DTGKPRPVSSVATASRAGAMPADGPYPLWPSRMARSMAAIRWGGVLKPNALAGGFDALCLNHNVTNGVAEAVDAPCSWNGQTTVYGVRGSHFHTIQR